MFEWFAASPGRLYVVATLVPLGVFVLLLVAGGLRSLTRPYRQHSGLLAAVYWVLGGDKPLRTGAYVSVVGMAISAVLAVVGLGLYLSDGAPEELRQQRWQGRIDWVRVGPAWEPAAVLAEPTDGSVPSGILPATVLQVGYAIDALTAVLFAMVAVVATCIFVFSLGYMREESEETVADAEAARQYGRAEPVRRRGRMGRFFLFLSLFCFSMLHLLIADNLFQVFVSWELVGVCSFWLIGFYYERPSASWAANKAFIINRIGDAGFLIGIAIAWTHVGTLNFAELAARLRGPGAVAGQSDHGGSNHREAAGWTYAVAARGGATSASSTAERYHPTSEPSAGQPRLVLLHPVGKEPGGVPAEVDVRRGGSLLEYGVMPYWLVALMGVGIFLGCVGKSAQWPLHTWLPDAMEGPTPVSALIHAATMVAAGVYLVGRAYPLFVPEVLLLIAYVGAFTAVLAASIALVQTDIKRILAYSTCSQLGLMFLALGVGGWTAGLLHLLTHAFFKALLFLCAGSVIVACHHEQDIRRMGGLWRRLPVTAVTMLVGVLAICGLPLLSGWYSKEAIMAQAVGFGVAYPWHAALLVLPLLTTALTAYYMFRLWLAAFTGPPRDADVYGHAHESPLVMTGPLVVLAALSIGGAWGWPLWEAEASWAGRQLARAEPAAAWPEATEAAHRHHLLAGGVALLLAVAGAVVAYIRFGRQAVPAEELVPQTSVGRFLWHKWYFDELYEAAALRPAVRLAEACAVADKRPTDAGELPATAAEPPPRRFDWGTLDGWLNAVGDAAWSAGLALRRLQSGRLRLYVLSLALTAAVLLGILTALAR